jgi:hypothetical protein
MANSFLLFIISFFIQVFPFLKPVSADPKTTLTNKSAGLLALLPLLFVIYFK